MVVGATLLALAGVFNPVSMTGPDALRVNPAQLAFVERPGFSCRFLDLDLSAGNNAFSFAQYNRYTGAFLDQKSKDDILGSIPGAGLGIAGSASASGVEFGFGNFAASVRTVGQGELSLPKDLFDLALYGNQLGRVYELVEPKARAQALLRAGAGVGSAFGEHFAVGVAAYYLRGLAYADVSEARGYFVTTETALAGEGLVAYRKASGGSGYSFDAGCAWWDKSWRVSLAVLDLGPGVTWVDGLEQGEFRFVLDSANAYQLKTEDRLSYGFETGAAAPFTSVQPWRGRLGISNDPLRWLSTGLSIECGVDPELFELEHWQAGLVAEFRPLTWLPLAAEVEYDSEDKWCLGADAGLALGRFQMLARFGFMSGVWDRAKGVTLGLGIGYCRAYQHTEPEHFRIQYGVN